MKWFHDLTISAKLVLGFTIMIFMMLLNGLNGFNAAKKIQGKLDLIYDTKLPSISYLLEADRDFQQLLVAERSMIFSNTKSDIFQGLVEEYEKNLKQAEERWQKYKKLASTSAELAEIAAFEKAKTDWQANSRKIIEGRIADTREGRREALDLSLGAAKEKFEAMRSHLDKLTEINQQLAKQMQDDGKQAYRTTIIILLAVLGIGLSIGIALALGIGRNISKALEAVIGGLNQTADQVASSSMEVSSASSMLAQGASEQAAGLEQTSASLEEITSMTKQNADNAMQANSLMNEAREIVSSANNSMTELTTAMAAVSQASEDTSKIIKTIDEIAFQTNLLALNAAVEAARAGEAGAGFAVVADEVRNLAMRAAEAAKTTESLIDGTVDKVTSGTAILKKANEAFSQITESSTKVAMLVNEISSASAEQAKGISQVSTAISEMDRVTQQNAASAEESAGASAELNSQVKFLHTLVDDLVRLVNKNSGAQKMHAPSQEEDDVPLLSGE